MCHGGEQLKHNSRLTSEGMWCGTFESGPSMTSLVTKRSPIQETTSGQTVTETVNFLATLTLNTAMNIFRWTLWPALIYNPEDIVETVQC